MNTRVQNLPRRTPQEIREANIEESTSDTEEPGSDKEKRKVNARLRTRKVTRRGVKTSTPVTIQIGKCPRFRKRVTNLKRDSLETVRRKLD